MTIAGFTSTGSKRPDRLFGAGNDQVPQRMERARGCIVRAADGRDYLDFIMALGAVALGYGHPDVDHAVIEAVERGAIGPLSPLDEPLLASELATIMPWLEKVRFFKTGAEACAAAVRIARVATGRELVFSCGYHGWLDWCSDGNGVPGATQALHATVPFNDTERTIARIRSAGDQLACVMIEPVIDAAPSVEWLTALRAETARTGAVLIFDEIKTAFRVALGGATERWRVQPDLTVLGKALANGYPLAAVGGDGTLMDRVDQTWISSTMATEFVSLAAARATVAAMRTHDVPRYLHDTGGRLLAGLHSIATRYRASGIRAVGIPEMCYLRYADEAMSQRVARACAARGLLFKRTAYNFVSLAHDAAAVDHALTTLNDILAEC
jgi:glutamate-1-semialdehyde 2,1-aminomutase